MAKRRAEETREETRKQTSIRRRDAEANRKVLIGLGAVGALLLLLIGAGIVQELVVKPRQPVATINDSRVSLRDYQKRVKFDWFQAGEVTDPQSTSITTLDTLVDEVLLREQAKQRNITVTEDEITEAIEKSFGYLRVQPTPAPTATSDPQATPDPEPTATPAPTATPITLESYQGSYKDYLAQVKQTTGMEEADFRTLVEIDLIRQKLYEDVTKDVPTTADQVHARHILVAIRTPAPTPEPTATGGPTPAPTATADPNATPAPTATPTPEPRDEAQALARVVEIQQKVGAGEDFAGLAQQYSDDPGSAAQGGELGWFARGSGLIQEFEDAAFELQAGQVSDPVRTDYGYHLIKVDERDPARELDAYTLQQKKYEAWTAWLTDLRNAAKVTRNWSLEKVPATPSPQ